MAGCGLSLQPGGASLNDKYGGQQPFAAVGGWRDHGPPRLKRGRFGIVKKNSILQVDYTNTLRAQGMERHEALIAANHVRLRPILMTTIAIVAGMIPIALGRGAGAGSRASMAVTILGGQILCLLLTLLVTPVVYSYFDDLREWSVATALRRFWREKLGRGRKVAEV